jgi:alpha-ribazole phosphatase/probable phosphoglycerate mutase
MDGSKNAYRVVANWENDNEKDIATGWLPGELSELGIEQAKNLVKQVADKKFDIVFCSDLKRAVDSAQLGFGDKYEIVEDSRLRECNYGDLNGAVHTFKDNMLYYVDHAFPNGESYLDTEKRMRGFCDFLKKEYDGKHVAIVAHQAPQLALEVIANGKTWDEAISGDWRKAKAWQPSWEYTIQ